MPDLATRPPGLEHLSAPERALLERLKAELRRRYGERLRAMILFGSRARGDARPDSDWDVAVVLDGVGEFWPEQRALSRLAFDLLLETGAAISLKLFRPEDLARQTLLVESIRLEGVPL